MKKIILLFAALTLAVHFSNAQTCSLKSTAEESFTMEMQGDGGTMAHRFVTIRIKMYTMLLLQATPLSPLKRSAAMAKV